MILFSDSVPASFSPFSYKAGLSSEGRPIDVNKQKPYLLKKYPRKKLNQAKSRFQVFYRIVN